MKKRPAISKHFKRFRQGDVVLKQVQRLPAAAIPERIKPLAVGEQSGHNHQLKEGVFRFWRDGTTRFVEVLETTNLVHEEHSTLEIPPGLYEQLDEREYDYFEEDAAQISD
jgi:hypothetical protein